MNDPRNKVDSLFRDLSKLEVEPSEKAREKSFQAFKKGFEGINMEKKRLKRERRKQVIGFSSTIAAAGIVSVLALSTGIFDDSSENLNMQGNLPNEGEQHMVTVDDEPAEQTDDIKEQILERRPLDFMESSSFRDVLFFHGKLRVYLPAKWTTDITEGEDAYSIRFSGPDGEQMRLTLFQRDAREAFHSQVQEINEEYADADEVPIPVDSFIEKLQSGHGVYTYFDNVFAFDTEDAEMTAFIDEPDGKLRELYTAELFGYPMIFTSDLPLDDTESWNLPIHLFATVQVAEPLVVPGSEGAPHAELKRPTEKTVLLPIGALSYPDEVEMKLHVFDELSVSGYLPKDAEIQRIEHDHFTEWRFTEPDISENSFYSFGKLHDDFPLEKGKEVMFDTFNIPSDFSPPIEDGELTHHYSYDTANSDESGIGVGGFFHLFERNGSWYYIHKHADWREYNGGYLISRLEYFRDSLESY